MPGWNCCTEFHQVLCQKGSQEKSSCCPHWEAGPCLVLPVLHRKHGTLGHFQIWHWQTAGRCYGFNAEYTLDVAPCMASKNNSWELKLSESHIPADLLAAATSPMKIGGILDIPIWSWQEMPCMMDCSVWQLCMVQAIKRLKAFW